MQAERVVLEKINAALEGNQPARSLTLKPDELALIKPLDLLTMKPMIYAANVAEGDLADQGASNPHVVAMRERAQREGSSLVIVSAQAGPTAHRPSLPAETMADAGRDVHCSLCSSGRAASRPDVPSFMLTDWLGIESAHPAWSQLVDVKPAFLPCRLQGQITGIWVHSDSLCSAGGS